MDKLMVFEKMSKVVVSSRVIAERFDKRHDHILRDIDSNFAMINKVAAPNFGETYFVKSKYIDSQNKTQPEYLLTRDGFSLLVMGFTGENALKWKLKYIETFNQMEMALRERQSTEWLQSRKNGKLIRREETDAIQCLIPYATEQGSKNANKFHMNYSKLVNKHAGIETGERNSASYKQLMMVAMLEDMVSATILEQIEKDIYYKNIYQNCKAKVEQFSALFNNKFVLRLEDKKELVLV